MEMSWKKVLEGVRTGLELEDAFARVGILPDEIEPYLDRRKNRRRHLARAQAEFKLDMTQIVKESAEIKRNAQSAQFFLRRKEQPRNQLSLRFESEGPATLELELPENGRTNEATPPTGTTD